MAEEQATLDLYKDIKLIEEIINKSAAKTASLFDIRQDWFHIYLARNIEGDNIMQIKPGHPVEIYFKWPEAFPDIGYLTRDALMTISKRKIHRTLEVIPFKLGKRWVKDIREKWIREYFSDESEIILDLLPKHRLQIKEIVSTTLEDIVTGEKYTVSREGKSTKFDGDDKNLWIQLSRQVRAKHPNRDDIDLEA
jgi:hypothetical protein